MKDNWNLSLIEKVIQLAEEAGQVILSVKNDGNLQINQKDDASPVTIADQKASSLIVAGLKKLSPHPVISEEDSSNHEFSVRKGFSHFWLVDPLDGTKEFIKNGTDYTVNIALIQESKPILGVIHVPELGKTYYAQTGEGVKVKEGNTYTRVTPQGTHTPPKVICSRSHFNPQTQAYLDKIGEHEKISAGSSMKFVAMAEGTADMYPRLTPCMEWDTAAGQILIEEAGCEMKVMDDDGYIWGDMTYNKESLLNPFFVVSKKGVTLPSN